jgi:hypothetical protein
VIGFINCQPKEIQMDAITLKPEDSISAFIAQTCIAIKGSEIGSGMEPTAILALALAVE